MIVKANLAVPGTIAKVGEPDKQLLVLVDAARIVGDDHRLSHSFDTQRLAEGAARLKLASKFA